MCTGCEDFTEVRDLGLNRSPEGVTKSLLSLSLSRKKNLKGCELLTGKARVEMQIHGQD